ncbi:hypothetical protein KEM48_008444 [Puccinia striiformis f. sp. tritici PST-130]|nr:hypothetical protein KEM48_008444 [Puccinia striiformis f. sp. tritici PST-130]
MWQNGRARVRWRGFHALERAWNPRITSIGGLHVGSSWNTPIGDIPCLIIDKTRVPRGSTVEPTKQCETWIPRSLELEIETIHDQHRPVINGDK